MTEFAIFLLRNLLYFALFLAATTVGGSLVGALAGHAVAGMSRGDLKELGESLDEGEAGLVVVAVMDMASKIEKAMERAEKVQAKELRADPADIERDARAAGGTEGPADG